jgi:hypothetical protein
MTIEHSKTTHSIYTSSPFECVEYSFAGSTIYYYKEDKLWNMEYLLTYRLLNKNYFPRKAFQLNAIVRY